MNDPQIKNQQSPTDVDQCTTDVTSNACAEETTSNERTDPEVPSRTDADTTSEPSPDVTESGSKNECPPKVTSPLCTEVTSTKSNEGDSKTNASTSTKGSKMPSIADRIKNLQLNPDAPVPVVTKKPTLKRRPLITPDEDQHDGSGVTNVHTGTTQKLQVSEETSGNASLLNKNEEGSTQQMQASDVKLSNDSSPNKENQDSAKKKLGKITKLKGKIIQPKPSKPGGKSSKENHSNESTPSTSCENRNSSVIEDNSKQSEPVAVKKPMPVERPAGAVPMIPANALMGELSTKLRKKGPELEPEAIVNEAEGADRDNTSGSQAFEPAELTLRRARKPRTRLPSNMTQSKSSCIGPENTQELQSSEVDDGLQVFFGV